MTSDDTAGNGAHTLEAARDRDARSPRVIMEGLRMARAGLPRPVAAVDVGSNSVRIAIVALDRDAQLEVLEEASATPRLIQDVQREGRLSDASIDEVVAILRDFRAIARGADADPLIAVATSAVRDAANGGALAERLQSDLGIRLDILDGETEARLAFLGAVHNLPVESGLVVDIGGGSMELLRFDQRLPGPSWTLPLGAVRLTAQFLHDDPPSQVELRHLREHITATLSQAGVGSLPAGGLLVGTGGTARNIAKVDRARRRYPIGRLHGYELSRDGVRSVADLVRIRTTAVRRDLPGLNEDRADIIVAGALVLQVLTEMTDAEGIVISGHGLREGIALNAHHRPLPPVDRLRESALDRAVGRFASSYRTDAVSRTTIAVALAGAAGLAGDEVPGAEILGTLRAASMLLDLGRGVDYYNRHRHTEALAIAYGLPGWSHRELALICAIVRQADSEKYDPVDAYRPLLAAADRPRIAAAAAILAAADELQRRTAHAGAPIVRQLESGAVQIDAEIDSVRLNALSGRLERTTGLQLLTEH